jgi:uncharacterized protein YeaO (DUF488 family)
MIRIKRAYEPPDKADGKRFLVERLWPRGMTKQALALDGWLKDVAPSNELRQWFKHDVAKWAKFQERYFAELSNNPEAIKPLSNASGTGNITLVYSAKDERHNSALALKKYLDLKR